MALSKREAGERLIDPELKKFLEDKHAVDYGVGEARGYVEFTEDNYVQKVNEAFAGAPSKSIQDVLGKVREDLLGKNKKGPTLLIPRFPPPGMTLSRIYPEYRPDKPVHTKPPSKHAHPDPGQPTDWPPKWKCPRGSHKKGDANYVGRYLDCKSCCTKIIRIETLKPWERESLQKHIDRSKGKTKEKAKSPTDHRGKNSNEPHPHYPKGKYQHLPGGWITKLKEHDHSWFVKREERGMLRRHVQHQHGGIEPDGPHEYPLRVKDRDNPIAMRLDVHLWALPFDAVDVVFFVIEGCIKADAILTYIRRHHLRASVFSVPATSQWHALELEEFARRYLPGKTVYIVADADGYRNHQVMELAHECQLFLTRLEVGITALVATPPVRTRRKWKGVDDYLLGGNRLEDMQVHPWELSDQLLPVSLAKAGKKNAKRLYDTLRAVTMLANPEEGVNRSTLRSMGKVMGCSRMTIARGLDDLNGAGILDVPDLKPNRRAYLDRLYNLGLIEDWPEFVAIPIPKHLQANGGKRMRRRKIGDLPKCDIGGELGFQALQISENNSSPRR